MSFARHNTLKNHFLIAMRSLSEGIFANSVAYICRHSEEGAMAIVINRPLNITIDDICAYLQIKKPAHLANQAILIGGPLHMENSFVLHSHADKQWEDSEVISDQVVLTTSKDIIVDIARNQGPEKKLLALGCAGWSAGQLEHEIANNAWLTVPANGTIIFDVPIERRAEYAAQQLGINLSLLSDQVGHA